MMIDLCSTTMFSKWTLKTFERKINHMKIKTFITEIWNWYSKDNFSKKIKSKLSYLCKNDTKTNDFQWISPLLLDDGLIKI